MSTTPKADSPERREVLIRRRARSRALLIVLLGLAGLFYAVSMARVNVRIDLAPGVTRGTAP